MIAKFELSRNVLYVDPEREGHAALGAALTEIAKIVDLSVVQFETGPAMDLAAEAKHGGDQALMNLWAELAALLALLDGTNKVTSPNMITASHLARLSLKNEVLWEQQQTAA